MKMKGKVSKYEARILKLDRAGKKIWQRMLGETLKGIAEAIIAAKKDGAKNLKIDVKIRY